MVPLLSHHTNTCIILQHKNIVPPLMMKTSKSVQLHNTASFSARCGRRLFAGNGSKTTFCQNLLPGLGKSLQDLYRHNFRPQDACYNGQPLGRVEKLIGGGLQRLIYLRSPQALEVGFPVDSYPSWYIDQSEILASCFFCHDYLHGRHREDDRVSRTFGG